MRAYWTWLALWLSTLKSVAPHFLMHSKNGGTLINRINSIAKSNPIYAEQLQKGVTLLESIGYK